MTQLTKYHDDLLRKLRNFIGHGEQGILLSTSRASSIQREVQRELVDTGVINAIGGPQRLKNSFKALSEAITSEGVLQQRTGLAAHEDLNGLLQDVKSILRVTLAPQIDDRDGLTPSVN
jgi:hypothetical protein